MTNNLTQPISKRLLLALLIITIGVEIILYFSGFSSLASSLYDAIMVASFFVGVKLHRRLNAGISKTKRQLVLQFMGAFLLFYLGSSMVNIYSAYAFEDFSNDYDEFVMEYTEDVVFEEDPLMPMESTEKMWAIVDEIDTVGYDIFANILAGLEEVWRLAYMILILVFFKKVFRRRWETGKRDIFIMAVLFITSILFGIDHTLNSSESWQYEIGATITFANMGLILGLILLWTRNLWLTVLVHAVYDIVATISWYYFDYAVELFALLLMPVYFIVLAIEKTQRRKIEIEQTPTEDIAN